MICLAQSIGGDMAIKLSNKNQKELDALLGQILDWHQNGDVTKSEAIGALAHVFTAAAIDNDDEVSSWLGNPRVLKRWKADLDAHRT